MNEQGKVEVINTILQLLGIISIFFAGFVLETLLFLAAFLFVGGVFVLQVKAIPSDEGDTEE